MIEDASLSHTYLTSTAYFLLLLYLAPRLRSGRRLVRHPASGTDALIILHSIGLLFAVYASGIRHFPLRR